MHQLAKLHRLPIHMHVHETAHEVQEQQQKTGQTPLQRLHHLGLLSPDFIAVHMTQLTDEDITLLAETGTHIVHCPESNLKLASGFCPVAKCLDAGINVAIGTDGAASNNDLDMLGEMRTAALLAKGIAGNPSVVPATTALEMATINGAKALGIDHETGSLSISKAADVTAIDLSQLETQPVYEAISQIVYAASRQQVSDVWVAGKQLLKQGQLTLMDTAELKANISEWQKRLKTI
jgi:5-methylthioadenosine/S-adenosylhomocysteine deaminase